MSSTPNIPQPHNEPILSYAPGTPERAALQEKLKTVWQDEIEIPVIVGGKEVRSGDTYQVVSPHDHGHTLATVHSADAATVAAAAAAAVEAQREWASWSFTDRAAVFLKAADLLAGPWRDLINASTMAGQSKTVFQAEIDAACEMITVSATVFFFPSPQLHLAEGLLQEHPYLGRIGLVVRPAKRREQLNRPVHLSIFLGQQLLG